MSTQPEPSPQSNVTYPPIPADDQSRSLVVVRHDTQASLPHLGVGGNTYTILLTGHDTAGRFTLIDMFVPPGGGPPPHRHDFEEMYTLLEGEVEFSFRGEKLTARAGDTLNIPANAPHAFRNASQWPARMLCMCSPSGQEEFFVEVGTPVSTRTTKPPKLDAAAQTAFVVKGTALAPKYRSEMLKP